MQRISQQELEARRAAAKQAIDAVTNLYPDIVYSSSPVESFVWYQLVEESAAAIRGPKPKGK